MSTDRTTHIHQRHVVLGDDGWLTTAFEIESCGIGLAVERGWITHRNGTLVSEFVQTRETTKD